MVGGATMMVMRVAVCQGALRWWARVGGRSQLGYARVMGAGRRCRARNSKDDNEGGL